MKIPSNKLWTQTNEGEVTGVLNETTNMALDTVGQAKLARKSVALMSSVSDADYEYTMAIVYFDNKYTVVTSDEVFQGELDGDNFTQEATFSPATTLSSDALVFNDLLIVTLDNNFARWNGGGSVSYTLGSLTSGVPHPLCIFDSNPTYKLAIGNGHLVHTYDTSWNLNPTILTLPNQFTVTTLRYRNGYLYVGTMTEDGSEARIFIWNGSGTSAQYECPVGAEWVFSMTEYGSSVAAITNAGQLIQISGSQFIQLAALPVYYNPSAKWMGSNGLLLNGKVFNRGMVTNGECIYLNIEGETDVGFIPEMKSGVWVFDPQVGLYHRGSSSTDTLVEDAGLALASNVLTTSTTHNLKTGDAVAFRTVSGLVGVLSSTTYYVTVISSTTIKLSFTREGVDAERFMTITGTPGVSDILIYYPNTDNGLQLSATSGAIALTTINETPLPMLSSEVLWGTRTKNEAGTAVYTLNAFNEQSNVGSLITQRIYTDNIEQNWKKIYTFLDGLVTDTDKVIVKVQTKYQATKIELSGVWATTSQLNSTSMYGAWGDIELGDELVFIDGKGQGKTVHVTAIDPSASVYSITVDEAIGTVSSTVSFYRNSFKKVGVWTKDQKENEYISSIITGATSPWVKIRAELRGIGTAVNMFDLSNAVHKSTI